MKRQTNLALCRQLFRRPRTFFFATNRRDNTACRLTGFPHWEQVQGAFRVGLGLPNGTRADGIGRCADEAEFRHRAKQGATTILEFTPPTRPYVAAWLQTPEPPKL